MNACLSLLSKFFYLFFFFCFSSLISFFFGLALFFIFSIYYILFNYINSEKTNLTSSDIESKDENIITIEKGKLNVPNNPTIPFIEGDGIGADVWRASRRVLDAAVKKAYSNERTINWIEALAGVIAAAVPDCDSDIAVRAARLAKADLVTGMVAEFPELQGIMGGYYARHDGEADGVADAVASHYRPQGPADALPATAAGCVVSLADKIDSLVGFFGVGAKPTGSKDPFALRRAALGIIRIIRERRIRMPLGTILSAAAKAHGFDAVDPDLLAFIRERLRVTLRDDGLAHDVVAAALGDDGAEGYDDILALADRAAALSEFLSGDDGTGLLAGWRRAASILNAEESKAKQAFSPETDPRLFTDDAEIALHGALAALPEPAARAQDRKTLLAAMQSLGGLRGPIDGFFDRVVVNDNDAAVRQNRLGLLAMVRHSMQRVADFSKLEG